MSSSLTLDRSLRRAAIGVGDEAKLVLAGAAIVGGGIVALAGLSAEPLAVSAKVLAIGAIGLAGVVAATSAVSEVHSAFGLIVVASALLVSIALVGIGHVESAAKWPELVATLGNGDDGAASVIGLADGAKRTDLLGAGAAVVLLVVVASVGLGAVPLGGSVADLVGSSAELLGRIEASASAKAPSVLAENGLLEAAEARGVVAGLVANVVGDQGALAILDALVASGVHALASAAASVVDRASTIRVLNALHSRATVVASRLASSIASGLTTSVAARIAAISS